MAIINVCVLLLFIIWIATVCSIAFCSSTFHCYSILIYYIVWITFVHLFNDVTLLLYMLLEKKRKRKKNFYIFTAYILYYC